MEPTDRGACPHWADRAVMYEVNIRQYTAAGTLRAFAPHLPRLVDLGVDILWLMPVFPISVRGRKGLLGSCYAVADYRTVNPQLGDMAAFKELVAAIHGVGLRVIMDWVPSHTGRDHPWLDDHPDWYLRDEQGELIEPIDPLTGRPFGWTDIATLNYDNPELRREMTDAMAFWVAETGIDGFRCDVAGRTPGFFWAEAASRLRALRSDLFLLAEAEQPEHRNEGWFCTTYGWAFHHLLNQYAAGKAALSDIDHWLVEDRQRFGPGYHLMFVTNHDENSWKGTVRERLGPAAAAMTVFCFTFRGMPLLYGGQEAGLDRRLKFFEKDQIDWRALPQQAFYRTLFDLKHRNRALGNGAAGGEPVRIPTEQDDAVYAYFREKEGDRCVVVLNLSKEAREIMLDFETIYGSYRDVFSDNTVQLERNTRFKLKAWDYVLLSNA